MIGARLHQFTLSELGELFKANTTCGHSNRPKYEHNLTWMKLKTLQDGQSSNDDLPQSSFYSG